MSERPALTDLAGNPVEWRYHEGEFQVRYVGDPEGFWYTPEGWDSLTPALVLRLASLVPNASVPRPTPEQIRDAREAAGWLDVYPNDRWTRAMLAVVDYAAQTPPTKEAGVSELRPEDCTLLEVAADTIEQVYKKSSNVPALLREFASRLRSYIEQTAPTGETR